MIYLADHGTPDKPVSLKEVAKNRGLSARYLEQLVVPLKNASLVRSSAGKYGGYFLARDPKEIKIGEIIEVVIGPIRLMDCLDTKFACDFLEDCTARRMWGLINVRITDVLHDYSLEDLSEEKRATAVDGEQEKSEKESVPC